MHIGEPYLYPSEGSAIQLVKFRMVVFRPFVGEVLVGRLLSSNKEGLRVSLDFFGDVIIPNSLFPSPCSFNMHDGLWTWKYGGEEEVDFVMDIGQEVGY